MFYYVNIACYQEYREELVEQGYHYPLGIV